jgi:hypothetical protein
MRAQTVSPTPSQEHTMAKKKGMVAKVKTAMKSVVLKAEKAMGMNGKKVAKKPAKRTAKKR